MNRTNRLWLPSLLLAVALPTAQAQAPGRAAIVGQVVDREGEPLPGVSITVRSTTAALPPHGAVTGADGRYRVAALPPLDDLLVEAEIPGYARVEVGPVALHPGGSTSVNMTLLPATEATQTIQVVAQGDILDLASTKTSTVFNSEFIEGLPIMGRTYQSVLTLAPGVTDVDGDGNPNVNGARDTAVKTVVDGANVTDPFSGTFGQQLNMEAIAEIEVISTGMGAEHGGASAAVSVMTRSGGNHFEGAFKLFLRSDLFDNDGANNSDQGRDNVFSDVDGFQDFRPNLSLGGPLLKDRLWYFVALEYISTEEPVHAGNQAFLQSLEGWNNFGKITWQVNPAHKISLQVTQDPRRATGLGLRTRVAPESDYYLDRRGTVTLARWSDAISPSALVETLVQHFDTGFDLTPVTDPEPCVTEADGRCNPFSEDLYTFDERTKRAHGPYFRTYRDQRLRDSLNANLSLYLDTAWGTHNVKTGLELSRESYENDLRITRQRIDDYAEGDDGFGDGAANTVTFRDALPGQQVRTADKDMLGFYVSDALKPIPNLSLKVGLRYDREDVSTNGWEFFEPAEQAAEFLELLARGQGVDPDGLDYVQAMKNPSIQHDINGDGLDSRHCSTFLDAYDNDSVTDYVVHDDGTYSLVGDPTPDGIPDSFFTFIDGDFDGVARFDDPDDLVLFAPGSSPDGGSTNPNCDRLNRDVETLFAAFSRHQFDENGVIDLPSGVVPGTAREAEPFRIVNDNIAPRLSLSWDPWGSNRNMFFASWNRYYRTILLEHVVPEVGPDTRDSIYSADDIDLGAGAMPFHTGRFTISQVDRDLRTPYSDELAFGYSRELAPNWLLRVQYIRTKERDLLQDVDVNHFVQDANGDGLLDDGFGRVLPPGGGGGGGVDGDNIAAGAGVRPDGLPDLFAYNPFFAQVLRVGNHNASDYRSVQLILNRRLSRNWQMNASYTWSEAVGHAETFDSLLGDDLGTARNELGPLSYDQTHQLKLSAVTHLAHKQTVGGIVQWASGLPYSRVLQVASSADSFGSTFARLHYPTGQRNDQRNEGRWRVDLHYRKGFQVGAAQASLGVEVQNLLNADDLDIRVADVGRFQGVDLERDFGRRWQLSMQVHF